MGKHAHAERIEGSERDKEGEQEILMKEVPWNRPNAALEANISSGR